VLITTLITAILLLSAVVATAVVFTQDSYQQIIGMSIYGLCLTIFFYLVQAPDVALAQIGVGTIALPMIVLLAMSKLQRRGGQRKNRKGAAS
jgi:uncharacterized MnhB-related membrane protein